VSFAPGAKPSPRRATDHGPSDLFVQLDLLREAERVKFAPERLPAMGINPGAAAAVDRVRRQLLRLSGAAREGRGASPSENSPDAHEAEESLLISILAGYGDRVARRKPPAARRDADGDAVFLALSNGTTARLAAESVVRRAEFMVAVEAEEKQVVGSGASAAAARPAAGASMPGGRSSATVVRTASAVEPEWLLDLFADELRETVEAQWNAQAERVEVTSRLLYDQLVIDEKRLDSRAGKNALSDEAERAIARTLADAALAAGLQRFVEPDEVGRFIARVAFAAEVKPDAGFARLGEGDVTEALVELCEGKRSFAELRDATKRGELIETLRQRLAPAQSALLERLAPEFVSLPSRRRVRVNYEAGKPPWIASRLQDFFGMTKGPALAEGRVPLVLHLLAPNQRPVQVTTDLAGFWTRHYPQIRRELSRRYPRHAWPEDPLLASSE
jgi:ATP-dependent helicase HrpB